MSQKLTINLGGPGENTTTELVIHGCGCRMDDFVLALFAFTNKWVNEANETQKNTVNTTKKPCGCGDAK